MPKKAVAIFFLLAFVGAALYVYFTFPRTKDQIPTSNNQRPFPSAPMPAPNTPNGVPVPDSVPKPNTPKVPPGPSLHVMAWASDLDAQRLDALADAFAKATGRSVALTLDADPASYRRDLAQALASGSAPDLCLVSSRDFCGLDPADLADARPQGDFAPRSLAAFTVDGTVRAVPDEFAVDLLFYNTNHFDRAGIAYPGTHWTWDILEADARALDSLHFKDAAGRPIYPLELSADLDLWNILCTAAGHPALDLDTWHVASDLETQEAQLHALDVLHELFHAYTITAPLPKGADAPGAYFAQQRASLLIAGSDYAAVLPRAVPFGVTLVPRDLVPASLAQVNGWAVTAKSTQADAARILAQYLAAAPVHAGWTSVHPPADPESFDGICHAAMSHALLPRLDAKTTALAQFVDKQIGLLARNDQPTTQVLYVRIQTAYAAAAGLAPRNAGVDPQTPTLRVEGGPRLQPDE
ncbi:MAG: extracellular solute-binding protein [Verrucomicrobiota bacterium]